jgi:hypothetical protein
VEGEDCDKERCEVAERSDELQLGNQLGNADQEEAWDKCGAGLESRTATSTRAWRTESSESVERHGSEQILFAVTIPCRATEYCREENRR